MKKNQKKVITNKKSGISAGKKVAIGAGVAALGVATAGAYYLLGPNAKAHQKKASILMAKMQKEAMQKAKKVKNLTEPLYHKAVDALAQQYSTQYKVHEKDIKAFAKTLKSEWKKLK